MLSQTLSHTDIVLLPVLALVVFATVFLAVVIRAWRRGPEHPADVAAARLPLDDDAPTCCQTDDGGSDA